MKKSIVFSLIILLVLCVSPIIAGGGPPSPTEATRPADGTPDDTNEGTDWDDPVQSAVIPLEEENLTLNAESMDIPVTIIRVIEILDNSLNCITSIVNVGS
ncbi:MAG: hypothetical protein R3F48_03810 [Candidatus Zixiibacteriota bacterium]